MVSNANEVIGRIDGKIVCVVVGSVRPPPCVGVGMYVVEVLVAVHVGPVLGDGTGGATTVRNNTHSAPSDEVAPE